MSNVGVPHIAPNLCQHSVADPEGGHGAMPPPPLSFGGSSELSNELSERLKESGERPKDHLNAAV